MAKLNYDEIKEYMKGVRLPSRCELHTDKLPDEEQMHVFGLRQQNIQALWAQKGIVFVKSQYLWEDGVYRDEKPAADKNARYSSPYCLPCPLKV